MLRTYRNVIAELDAIDNLPLSYRESLERIFNDAPDAIT